MKTVRIFAFDINFVVNKHERLPMAMLGKLASLLHGCIGNTIIYFLSLAYYKILTNLLLNNTLGKQVKSQVVTTRNGVFLSIEINVKYWSHFQVNTMHSKQIYALRVHISTAILYIYFPYER